MTNEAEKRYVNKLVVIEASRIRDCLCVFSEDTKLKKTMKKTRQNGENKQTFEF